MERIAYLKPLKRPYLSPLHLAVSQSFKALTEASPTEHAWPHPSYRTRWQDPFLSFSHGGKLEGNRFGGGERCVGNRIKGTSGTVTEASEEGLVRRQACVDAGGE